MSSQCQLPSLHKTHCPCIWHWPESGGGGSPASPAAPLLDIVPEEPPVPVVVVPELDNVSVTSLPHAVTPKTRAQAACKPRVRTGNADFAITSHPIPWWPAFATLITHSRCCERL